ncbi:MAG: NADH/ubiquinone/plastoquinone (complex I) [Ectothiorhodospiraceae bacterium]|nr:NADH/ubiquinone/plastoquinone (complex I) [Ectothiorhodospiraceae bacterium]
MLGAASGVAYAVMVGGGWSQDLGGWAPPLGIGWQVDGLSASLLLLTAIVGSAGAAHRAVEGLDQPFFWPLWLFLWGALNALFLGADLFNLYVALEVLALAAVALIAMAGGGALPAAWRYLLASLLGSTVYLMGVALLYGRYGALDLGLIAGALEPDLPSALGAGLICLGLLLKAAVFPLHFWLPSAHGRAPTVVSAALSALVVAAAWYLLVRLWFGPFAGLQGPGPDWLFGLIGTGAMLWGGLLALVQRRLKMLIAYSTVSQLGFGLLVIPLAVGAGAESAWRGAVVLVLAHGLAKAGLFLAAGSIARAHGHDRLDALGGMGAGVVLPWLALVLAGASLIGLPPSGGFLGKWWMLQGALAAGGWVWVAAILLGTLLTAVYVFRMLSVVIRPAAPVPPAGGGGLPGALPAFVLALLALGLGLAAPVLEHLLSGDAMTGGPA